MTRTEPIRLSLATCLVFLSMSAASVARGQVRGEAAGSRDGARQQPARQQPARQPARTPQGGRGGRGALQEPGAQANQQALVRQVRQAFNVVVRRELDLDDQGWRHLQDVERRYQQQRNQLNREEHEARLSLKAAMEDTTGGRVDQQKVGRYMDQLVQAQHRRADLLEAEQSEFASFLTPLQRAKYQALREQLNKRIQALRRETAGGAAPQQP